MGVFVTWPAPSTNQRSLAKPLPAMRAAIQSHISALGEGPSEVQKHVVARDILGASLR